MEMFFWVLSVVVAVVVYWHGARIIPTSPYTVAITKLFGYPVYKHPFMKRFIKPLKGPGTRFYFLRGLVFSYDLAVIEEERRVIFVRVATPDNVWSDYEGIGFTIAPSRDDPEAILELTRTGGIKEAADEMEGKIRDRLGKFASNTHEGPQTAEELRGSMDEIVAVLLQMLAQPGTQAGELLPVNFPRVPTTVLLRFFSPNRGKPLPSEQKEWGENFERVQEILDRLPAEELEALKVRVENRRNAINDLRQGRARFRQSGQGSDLVRLSVVQPKPASENVMRALEARIRVRALRQQAREMRDNADGLPDLSPEAALRAAQLANGHLTETINNTNVGLSSGTERLASELIPQIAEALTRRRDG